MHCLKHSFNNASFLFTKYPQAENYLIDLIDFLVSLLNTLAYETQFPADWDIICQLFLPKFLFTLVNQNSSHPLDNFMK